MRMVGDAIWIGLGWLSLGLVVLIAVVVIADVVRRRRGPPQAGR